MSRWLLDTNMLLRGTDHSCAEYQCANDALIGLTARGHQQHVANQSMFEFWVVATRAVERNGLGLPIAQVASLLDQFEEDYIIQPDPPSLLGEWRRLVYRYSIRSFKAHDIRQVAYARLSGIPRLLTFNTEDFKALKSEIEVVSPADFLANPDAYSSP